MTRGKLWRLASLIVLFCYSSVTGSVLAEEVDPPDEISRDGTVNVDWRTEYEGYEHFIIRTASGQIFAVYPAITGQNWSLSGLSDGEYQIGLSSEPDTITKPVLTLRVDHYSLRAALSLFGIGFILFTYLIITLKRGDTRHD